MFLYTCEHFGIKELVSPKAFKRKGNKCWRWFHPDALKGLDMLWEEFGPKVYCNTWSFSNPHLLGPVYNYSGFHLPGEFSRSDFSGHPHWGAFDLKFAHHTSKDIRIALLGEEPTETKLYPKIKNHPYITEIEFGVNWLHVRFGSNVDGVLVYPGG